MDKVGFRTTPSEALNAFHRYQRRRGHQASTQRAYNQFLEPFVVWIGNSGFDRVDARDIEFGWLEHWTEAFQARWSREPSTRHVRNHLTALKVFFDFLDRFGYLNSNPMRRIDRPAIVKRAPDWLTTDEDAAMLGAVSTPLERILIPLLRWTGMRASESEALRWQNVHFVDREIWVTTSKTPGGRRAIPMFDPLMPAIEEWHRRQASLAVAEEKCFVLATASGKALSHTQVWVTVKRVAHRAGVRRQIARDRGGLNVSTVSPHTLRRTFASDLFNRGARLEVISRLLGHSETRTTEASYAHLLDARISWEARSAYARPPRTYPVAASLVVSLDNGLGEPEAAGTAR
jgi:integrase/recombinase XerD